MTTDRTASRTRRQVRTNTPKKRPSRAFWMKALAECSKKGLSVQEFCRLKNLSPSNFYTWRKRLRDEENDKPRAPASFIPLEVMTADNSPVPSNKDLQTKQASFFPAMEKGGEGSGLYFHLNENHKISIDKEFHEPTLQRLVQLFSYKESAIC